jgi:3-(3-hydroxy-phenyl)propionate hydroxylase
MASDFDVLVVGCGPVGATAANLLGMYGVRTLVLDRRDAIYELPRAGTCDDETMRIWQMVGLSQTMMPHLLPQTLVQFLGKERRPFLEVRRTSFGYGYPGLILQYQPFVEETLRKGIARFSSVELRLGAEFLRCEPREEHVVAVVKRGAAGTLEEVTARFVVGCDGAHSTVREGLGIHLSGRTFQRWLVIDLSVEDPDEFPGNFQFVCNPRRPAITYPMAFNHHRFQFMLEERETPEEMEQPQIAHTLLAPWTDGRRFQIVRQAVYTYHARIAESWRRGPVFLAGDSAHLTPPFAGQGMSSGIRDVANLCWKLGLVVQGVAHPAILDSYEHERRPHVTQMTQLARRIALLLQTRSWLVASARDNVCRALTSVPGLGPFLTTGGFKPSARLDRGWLAPATSKRQRGWLFLQPRVEKESTPLLFDDVLGSGFAVVGFNLDPRGLVESNDPLWQKLHTRFLEVRSTHDGGSHVIDVDGTLGSWFSQHDAAVAILRPDRYVFGLYSQSHAHRALQDLREALAG